MFFSYIGFVPLVCDCVFVLCRFSSVSFLEIRGEQMEPTKRLRLAIEI